MSQPLNVYISAHTMHPRQTESVRLGGRPRPDIFWDFVHQALAASMTPAKPLDEPFVALTTFHLRRRLILVGQRRRTGSPNRTNRLSASVVRPVSLSSRWT